MGIGVCPAVYHPVFGGKQVEKKGACIIGRKSGDQPDDARGIIFKACAEVYLFYHGLCFLIIGMADPQIGTKTEEVKAKAPI